MTGQPRPLADLLIDAGIRPLEPPGANPDILGASLDSRRTARGDVFFALPGLIRHGVEFVRDALARGARAVLSDVPRPAWLPVEVAWIRVEEPRGAAGVLARECYGRPDERIKLVGITGTNGKTTVSYLLESIARAAGVRTGRIGTVGYGFDGTEEKASHTTPEAPDLYRLLRDMLVAGVELVAIEVSSHALVLRRVAGAKFRVAALISFGRDHLDFHGTIERYFEAKASLFDNLDAAIATAVLPSDDPAGPALRLRTRAGVVTFGRSPASDVRITEEHCRLDGSRAVLRIPSGAVPIHTSLLGRLNLDNIAAATASALAAGCPVESIAAGVEALDRVPGRLERVDRGQPFAVLVDYAHTPEALERLLCAVRELVDGRLLIVFGCGGERDRGKRPQMGRIAAERADCVYLTSDNPRGEDPVAILRETEAGLTAVPGGSARCRVTPDRGEAVAAAIGSARPGDAVIIAGKGHETTQTAGGLVIHFDDREAAIAALTSLGYAAGARRAGA